MLRIWRATGKTFLFVTHAVEEAVYLGSRVVVLGGRPGTVALDVPVELPEARRRRAAVARVRRAASRGHGRHRQRAERGVSPVWHWFLPSSGDGRDVTNVISTAGQTRAGSRRAPTTDYLGDVARAAEQAGFSGALTPTGAGCEEAWVLCAALSARARRLRFIVAFRPGHDPPDAGPPTRRRPSSG